MQEHVYRMAKVTLHNQIELPPLDSFRLGHILDHVVKDENKQLSDSILNVKSHFQSDLRQELRRTLTREQRIQHKNIELVKNANSVRKKMKGRKKQWAKLGLDGENAAEKDVLPVEIDSLYQTAGSISDNVLSLVSRLQTIDSALGGSGLPDRNSYPMLWELSQHQQEAGQIGEEAESEAEQMAEEASDSEAHTVAKNHTQTSFQESSKLEGSSLDAGLPDSDGEINSEIFENLINAYTRKARHRAETPVEPTARPSRPRNALRLLSVSSTSSDTSVLDRMENRFFPVKSLATVGESPELTHHKKLRITALPLTKENGSCRCSKTKNETILEAGSGASDHRTSDEEGIVPKSGQESSSISLSPAERSSSVAQTLSTFLSNYDAQFRDDENTTFDLNFDSSGIHSDSDHLDVSSDSSASFDGSIGDTNEYYDSLQQRVRRKYRKTPERTSQNNKESSPNPKHQPSHRTLQPKQSILKLQRKKQCDFTDVSVEDAIFTESQFMASPRSSFVMENSAAGQILRHGNSHDSLDTAEPEALSRLRNLLL